MNKILKLLVIITTIFLLSCTIAFAQEASPEQTNENTTTVAQDQNQQDQKQQEQNNNSEDAQMDKDGKVTQVIADDKTEVNLSLLTEMEGYEIEIKNENGDVVGKTTLDVRGVGKVLIPRGKQIFINLTSNKPKALNTSKSDYPITIFDVIKWTLGGMILTGIITYFITRKKIMAKFKDAVDVIYNEELDD